MNRNESLSGKVVLVTGATSGIGFHTASALARFGAMVYATNLGAAHEAGRWGSHGHKKQPFGRRLELVDPGALQRPRGLWSKETHRWKRPSAPRRGAWW